MPARGWADALYTVPAPPAISSSTPASDATTAVATRRRVRDAGSDGKRGGVARDARDARGRRFGIGIIVGARWRDLQPSQRATAVGPAGGGTFRLVKNASSA